jgi:hypothetical protein
MRKLVTAWTATFLIDHAAAASDGHVRHVRTMRNVAWETTGATASQTIDGASPQIHESFLRVRHTRETFCLRGGHVLCTRCCMTSLLERQLLYLARETSTL